MSYLLDEPEIVKVRLTTEDYESRKKLFLRACENAWENGFIFNFIEKIWDLCYSEVVEMDEEEMFEFYSMAEEVEAKYERTKYYDGLLTDLESNGKDIDDLTDEEIEERLGEWTT